MCLITFDPAVPFLGIYLKEIIEVQCEDYHEVETYIKPKKGQQLNFQQEDIGEESYDIFIRDMRQMLYLLQEKMFTIHGKVQSTGTKSSA